MNRRNSWISNDMQFVIFCTMELLHDNLVKCMLNYVVDRNIKLVSLNSENKNAGVYLVSEI